MQKGRARARRPHLGVPQGGTRGLCVLRWILSAGRPAHYSVRMEHMTQAIRHDSGLSSFVSAWLRDAPSNWSARPARLPILIDQRCLSTQGI